MDGNQKAQIRALSEMIDKWSTVIKIGELSTTEVWTSFSSGLVKSASYPLVATRLTKEACNQLNNKEIQQAVLSALHVSRSLPTSIVHAPMEGLEVGLFNF